MIAALLVAAVFAVQGATSLAAPNPKLAITQTVSGGTDIIWLTGTNWPANSTVTYDVFACDKSMGRPVNCSDFVPGSLTADDSGSFSIAAVDSVPCGSKTEVVADASALTTKLGTAKKLAC
jgi:hypothetical protein